MSVWVREGHTVVHAREGMSRSMPSENEAKFAIGKEMRALRKHVNELIAIEQLFQKGVPQETDKVGEFESLDWMPTKSGVGEIVWKERVPAWVKEYPDMDTQKGTRVDGYVYKLFESGVLWRKKV